MKVSQLEELLAKALEEQQTQLQVKAIKIAQLEELLATAAEEHQTQLQETGTRIAQLEELLANVVEEHQTQLQEKGMKVSQLEELLAKALEEQQTQLQVKAIKIAQLEELLATAAEEHQTQLQETGTRIAQLEELLARGDEERQAHLQEKHMKFALLEELLERKAEEQQELMIRMHRVETRAQAWITRRLTAKDQVVHKCAFNTWRLFTSWQMCWKERKQGLLVAERFSGLQSAANRCTFNAWRFYMRQHIRWRDRRHRLVVAERFLGLHAAAYQYVFSSWSLQVRRRRHAGNKGCKSLTAASPSDQRVVAEAFSTWLMASRIARCRNRHLLNLHRVKHHIAALRCEHRDCVYAQITFSKWRWEATKALLEFRIVQIWDLLHSCKAIAAESRERLVQRLWLSELSVLVRTALMLWRQCLEDSNNTMSCSHLQFVISALAQESASVNHTRLLGPAF